MIVPKKSKRGFRPRTQPKRASKSLTKLQKQEVKKLVAEPMETKYVAAPTQVLIGGVLQPVTGYSVNTTITSGGPATSAWSLIPSLPQATSGVVGTPVSTGSQRTGNKVAGVSFKNDFQFYINTGLAGNVTVDATVKLFICRAKQIKSNYNLTSLSAGTLLDQGDGTSIDWTIPTGPNDALLNAMLPINKEAFTVLKSYTFRIAKNQEAASGGVGLGGSPNMDSAHARTISYTHKHPSSLLYLDDNVTPAGVPDLPTNFNYFAFCVVYESQAGSLPANSILCNSRSHMWFKDP